MNTTDPKFTFSLPVADDEPEEEPVCQFVLIDTAMDTLLEGKNLPVILRTHLVSHPAEIPNVPDIAKKVGRKLVIMFTN